MAKPQDPNEQIEVELAPGAVAPLSQGEVKDEIPPDSLPVDVEPLTGTEPDEEAPPLPWGETPIDELLEHEALAPFLAERKEREREEARQEYYSKLQPLIAQNNQQLAALSRQGGEFIKSVQRATQNGNLDPELLDRYEDAAQKISGAYWHVGRFDGAKSLILEIGQAIEDEDLLKDFTPRIDLLQMGGTDEDLFKDLLKRVTKKADTKGFKEADEKGYERGLAEGRKQAIEEMKAQNRATKGPDLTPKGPGAGSVLTLDRYRNMSPDERSKLTAQQIDAMTAEVARQYG